MMPHAQWLSDMEDRYHSEIHAIERGGAVKYNSYCVDAIIGRLKTIGPGTTARVSRELRIPPPVMCKIVKALQTRELVTIKLMRKGSIFMRLV